jgi:HK97 family phage major capsid protein
VKLNAILTEIDEKTDKVRELFDEEDEKGVDHRATIEQLHKELEELDKQAKGLAAHEARRAENEGRIAARRIEPAVRPVMPGGADDHKVAAAVRQSLGQKFIESAEWRDYIKMVAPTGEISQNQRVHSPKLVLPYSIKAVITGLDDASGGAFVETDYSGIFETLGRRPLTIRDIISVRTTNSDLIHYVRQLTHVNAAAPVAEATATAGSSGVKPEGDWTFDPETTSVKTIAEWAAITKRALADVGQMRGIIDQELRADLAEKVEDEILTGDGTGEHFVGLDAVSGTQDQAWSTNALTTTRKARTLVRTVGRATPTAFVMNPTDWETMDLLQDNEARYYFGGPAVLGQPRLWGLPVVESEGQPVGNAWVGDWRKAVLWDRQQAMISVSDSHSDFFIRNLVAILGELRAAFAVVRPSAFVEVDLTA